MMTYGAIANSHTWHHHLATADHLPARQCNLEADFKEESSAALRLVLKGEML
jgi:hypothetical protein